MPEARAAMVRVSVLTCPWVGTVRHIKHHAKNTNTHTRARTHTPTRAHTHKHTHSHACARAVPQLDRKPDLRGRELSPVRDSPDSTVEAAGLSKSQG